MQIVEALQVLVLRTQHLQLGMQDMAALTAHVVTEAMTMPQLMSPPDLAWLAWTKTYPYCNGPQPSVTSAAQCRLELSDTGSDRSTATQAVDAANSMAQPAHRHSDATGCMPLPTVGIAPGMYTSFQAMPGFSSYPAYMPMAGQHAAAPPPPPQAPSCALGVQMTVPWSPPAPQQPAVQPKGSMPPGLIVRQAPKPPQDPPPSVAPAAEATNAVVADAMPEPEQQQINGAAGTSASAAQVASSAEVPPLHAQEMQRPLTSVAPAEASTCVRRVSNLTIDIAVPRTKGDKSDAQEQYLPSPLPAMLAKIKTRPRNARASAASSASEQSGSARSTQPQSAKENVKPDTPVSAQAATVPPTAAMVADAAPPSNTGAKGSPVAQTGGFDALALLAGAKACAQAAQQASAAQRCACASNKAELVQEQPASPVQKSQTVSRRKLWVHRRTKRASKAQ